ncbi:hypothetical protein [Azotobacter chroococcum]|nr:hypothetical protein [Azotobacter chroococcum]
MQRNTPSQEAERDWPRDFDVRAEYAEQQELLAAEREPLPTPAQDTRNNG